MTYESPVSYEFSTGGTTNPILALGTQLFPFSEREAELIRNFSENMALWVSVVLDILERSEAYQNPGWNLKTKLDITDIERHFEIDVPRRALSNPILRYAIFTFSSRHLNRRPGGNWTEALEYHTNCLQLLIPVLSGGQEGYTEDILAAVAILRLNEEMDGMCVCMAEAAIVPPSCP
jgi:hypothetical protein